MDKGIALNAGTFYSDTALDYGKFGVSASPKPGVCLRAVENAIDAVLTDVVEHAITAHDLARAKTGLIADAVYAQDSQATLARWYGSGLAASLPPDRIRTWPDRLRAVTAESVQQAAKQWLDMRRSVTGYLV